MATSGRQRIPTPCDHLIPNFSPTRPNGTWTAPWDAPRGTHQGATTYLRCHRTPPECERTAVSGAERTPLGPAAAISRTEKVLDRGHPVDGACLFDELPDLIGPLDLAA